MLAYFVSAPSMHSNYAVAGSPSIRLVWLVSITTVSFQNWFLKQSLLKWKHEEDDRRGVAIKCAFKYWHFQNWRHPPPCLPINFRGGSCPGGKCTKVGGGRCHKNRGGRCHKNGGGKCPGGISTTTLRSGPANWKLETDMNTDLRDW